MEAHRTYALELPSQVGVLEQDTLEVLSLVRYAKNSLAPISQIPRAILSLIPNHWERQDAETDKALITLTHVCRGWRELFISQSSLWTRLDFMNVDKTLTYIKRSRSSPLDVVLFKNEQRSCLEGAFVLAVPHTRRFKSFTMTAVGTSDLQRLSKHLTLPAPYLKELTISFACRPATVLDVTLFNGDFSSLHTLSLTGVVTHLPWKNLWNLTTFKLRCAPDGGITITRLLDFLESLPRLRNLTLRGSIPTLSNAPPGRIVVPPHLKKVIIDANSAHSTFLNHLSIPEGAQLDQHFKFSGNKSPLPDYLPKSIKNLKNLFRITTVDICLDKLRKLVRLDGPSGGLRIWGNLRDKVEITPSVDLDHSILQSLGYFSLHMTRRLMITKYELPTLTEISKSPPYHILLRMKNLHILTLSRCNNLPFIFALNPGRNLSKVILCPNLEELVLYLRDAECVQHPGAD